MYNALNIFFYSLINFAFIIPVAIVVTFKNSFCDNVLGISVASFAYVSCSVFISFIALCSNISSITLLYQKYMTQIAVGSLLYFINVTSSVIVLAWTIIVWNKSDECIFRIISYIALSYGIAMNSYVLGSFFIKMLLRCVYVSRRFEL